MRKLYLMTAVLVIGALFLGACGDGDADGSAGAGDPADRSTRRPRGDGRARRSRSA